MSENNMQKQPYRYDRKQVFQKRVFNADSPEMPFIKPGAGIVSNGETREQELSAMCKNPRQSAELIRYLIEFIKSL